MNNKDTDYPIGYKKPPRHTQFKPGQSGNPKGRPKQAISLERAFWEELGRSAIVNIGNRAKKIRMTRIIAKRHVTEAAKGDPKSTAIVLAVTRGHQADQGDKLGDLQQQFRAIHERHLATDRSRTRSKKGGNRNGDKAR